MTLTHVTKSFGNAFLFVIYVQRELVHFLKKWPSHLLSILYTVPNIRMPQCNFLIYKITEVISICQVVLPFVPVLRASILF